MDTSFSEKLVLPVSWIVAFSVVAVTLLAVVAVRFLLSRFAKNKHFSPLQSLTPAISNLVLVVGLKMFAETAPLGEKLSTWLNASIYVFSVFLILWLVRRAVLVGMEWSAKRTQNPRMLEHGLVPLTRNLVTLFVFITGGIMVLSYFGYDVWSLVTALGVGSLAVGLAAKDILSHMFSGFILVMDRNIRAKDRINLGGTTGEVEEIGLRSTRIKLGNGNTLIVPNTELVNTKILNLSMPSRGGKCVLSLKLPLEVPFEKAKTLCLEESDKLRKLRTDQPRSVHLSSVGDGNQILTISFWIQDLSEESSVLSVYNRRLLDRMAEEQIKVVALAVVPT